MKWSKGLGLPVVSLSGSPQSIGMMRQGCSTTDTGITSQAQGDGHPETLGVNGGAEICMVL